MFNSQAKLHFFVGGNTLMADNYSAGAITALSNMAELGASKKDVFEVAGMMDLIIDDDIDESDKERLLKAYGDLTPPEGSESEKATRIGVSKKQQCLHDVKADAVKQFVEFNKGRYTNAFDKDISDAFDTYAKLLAT